MFLIPHKLCRIIKGKSFLSLLLRVMGMGFSYLFSMIVSHLYGAEGWGIFSLIFTMVLLGSYILKFGFDTALLKLTAENETKTQRGKTKMIYLAGVKYIFPIVIISCILFYFMSDSLSDNVFHKKDLGLYLPYVSLLTLPAVFILINSEGLRGLGKVNQYALFQNSSVFALGTIGVIIIELTNIGTHSISEIFIVYTISTYIIYLISQLSWWKELTDHSSDTKYDFRFLYSISIPMFWIGVMQIVIGWTDTILLGIFSTEKEVGIYNVALKVSNLIIVGRLSMGAIVANRYANLYASNDIQGLKYLVRSTSKKTFLLSVPIMAVILVYPQLPLRLFGEEFQEGAIVLIVLALGHFMNSIYGTPDILLQMTGQEHFLKIIMTLAVFLNLTLNLVLIPHLGGLGCAIANLTSLTFWNIGCAVRLKSRMDINCIFNPFILFGNKRS